MNINNFMKGFNVLETNEEQISNLDVFTSDICNEQLNQDQLKSK